MSAEISLSLSNPDLFASSLLSLLSHMSPTTLVAGPSLPGHTPPPSFPSPPLPLGGRTCPWNTVALWSASLLSRTGFLMVSDLPPSAGIEEVAAISTLQKLLSPSSARAVVVHNLPGFAWDTSSLADDPKRQEWHERKMASKETRAAAQLELLRAQQDDALAAAACVVHWVDHNSISV
jgi:hypothetical protein